MKRYFLRTNAYNCVLFVDEKGEAVYIDEAAFDEPLTLEVAEAADYSQIEGYEDAATAAANYYTGSNHLTKFDPDDFEEVIEF